MICSPISQVVARNSGDDHMLQVHSPDRFRDTQRLVDFQGKWLSRGNRTKTARTRTPLASDHESSGSLTPALPTIWTLGGLAYRVQPQIRNQRLGGKKDWT